MKKLVVVFLCLFASNACASSADSVKCPWKMPFTIEVHGIGFTDSSVHHYMTNKWESIELDADLGVHPSNETFWITVDTMFGSQYSLKKDILHFSALFSDSISTFINFVTGRDSIVSFQYSEFDTASGISGTVPGTYRTDSFQISSLSFDGTSIFAFDSSFSTHAIRMTAHLEELEWRSVSNSQGQILNDQVSTISDFTASSVTLSGIFRPTTFSNPPAIVTEAPQPNNLAIYSSNGSITCSFDVADHARELEIYSPLGIREASFTIPAGQTEASLPHLPVGFYFVRLEGSMAKIYISGY